MNYSREQFYKSKDVLYKVYKHTSPSNKVYIGITSQPIKARWGYGSHYHHNAYLTSAIKKYGWDNFKHEILYEGLTKEEACNKEIELIALYKSNDRRYGYNQSSCGEHGATGYKMTDAQRKVVTIRMKSRTLSDEHKERLRKLRLGVPNSEEARQKMSIARKGEKHSSEWVEKIANANRGKKGQEGICAIQLNTFLMAK